MLRVTTLYASSAAASAGYYTQYLTDAPGEQPGIWCGRQADLLGLGGPVNGEQLQALLEGRDPVSGTPLGMSLVDRVTKDGGTVRAVAGFDATISAPKSVSVLWALTCDAGYLEAHDAAVTAALGYLERFGSTTRIRSNGRRLHPDSQGLIMATFRQSTSRADDPQLHTHAVISAKVQTAEGRWLALDARFLKKHQRMLGGLYQSVLRSELANRFGVAWQPIENGQAEIAGMPAQLLEQFSKRTVEVEHALDDKLDDFRQREGRDPTSIERAALTRQAAVDTRSRKTGHGVPDLQTRWQREANRLGWSAEDVDRLVSKPSLDEAHAPAVTVAGVVDQLSARGSTWARADIVRTICDLQPVVPNMSADRWLAALERASDRIIDECVQLDPEVMNRQRVSDGRSEWLEPIAANLTSDTILDEEARVFAWALDAEIDQAQPSGSVDTAGLDVLQADVAAAVAGQDRLVLAVGPAGTGKTTTLRAAANDIWRADRIVFGLAPSAKAARVLERETGIPSDTVHKLLYEHLQTERPPNVRYQLPPGATVIVDEAGMLGTASLAQLATLAEQHRWRVVLIGDPHQLQAVGRGGMFHELCATGRTLELQKIHRFTNPWEAAASLQLRHGDPDAIDTYIDQRRICAGHLDEHIDAIAGAWLFFDGNGDSVAITASTNEHVDRINQAIQRRRFAGHRIDPADKAVIADGATAHVGDRVVTRRNDRTLTTTTGEPVRNRDLWTVSAIHPDGSMTVDSQLDAGTVTLPFGYIHQHVQLGYAATEHGNQGDTVTIGIELATPATSRRGLYVGATRGRTLNMIHVVTETSDREEARSVLRGILANDRVDLPALAQRRELAQTAPATSPSTIQPRCEIPPWFNDVRQRLVDEMNDAIRAIEARNADRALRREAADEARDLLPAAVADADPFEAAARAASDDRYDARRDVEAATQVAGAAGPLHRRRDRAALADAKLRLDRAEQVVASAEERARPTRERVNALRQTIKDEYDRTGDILHQWADHDGRIDRTRRTVEALDTWQHWAAGDDLALDQVVATLEVFRSERDNLVAGLGEELNLWLQTQPGIPVERAHRHRLAKAPEIELPG